MEHPVRPSNRELIIDAAVELFATSGAESVTYDDLAAQTGLTKSGIVYHFATRQLILEAVAGRLIDGWAEAAASHAADEPDDPPHRFAAFVAGMLEGDATPAELRLAVETIGGRRMHDEWHRIRAHWLQPDDATPAQLTAVAAALGLWVSRATGFLDFDAVQRAAIEQSIRQLAAPGD
ncbi:hypothetical protein A9Z40_11360 [Microbacterium arborescens]|uniref:HTH tetR-type domain-containing protein n=1 Tax=Microbacterium arborescens TaxID=33883 RepID=A0ABX2WLY1_9MICO|nr:hypothetical protein A9Z40_11360 [Microbacterium arborescens]